MLTSQYYNSRRYRSRHNLNCALIPSGVAFQYVQHSVRSTGLTFVLSYHFASLSFLIFVILFLLERSRIWPSLSFLKWSDNQSFVSFFRASLSKATDDWEHISASACDGLIAQCDLWPPAEQPEPLLCITVITVSWDCRRGDTQTECVWAALKTTKACPLTDQWSCDIYWTGNTFRCAELNT